MTVPQPLAVPQPIKVSNLVVAEGGPETGGVIVSILSVVRVTVVGTVAVTVVVIVTSPFPASPGIGVVVGVTPDMTPVVIVALAPGG